MNFLNRHIRATFVTPALVFVIAMMIVPIIYTTYLSFHAWNGSARRAPEYLGLDNYTRLLTRDPRFGDAVARTFIFTGIAVGAELALGLGIALLINGKFMGHNLVKTLILLPMVATPVAIGMAWLLLYEPNIGALNALLRGLGLPPQDFLGSANLALFWLAVVDIWQWTPLMALILLAGLTALPEEPYEAARVDGASGWQRFRHLTLPLLFPTMIAAVLLRSIDALKTFDIIYTMTRGGPGFATETINTYGYIQSFEYFQLGQASSLLIVFFTLILAVSLFFVRIRRHWGAAL
jgi:multiple sugar transport system permease protein